MLEVGEGKFADVCIDRISVAKAEEFALCDRAVFSVLFVDAKDMVFVAHSAKIDEE